MRGIVTMADLPEQLVDVFDSFGSFVFAQYGYIPADGTQFEIDSHGMHIKATQITEHRLESSVVCKI